MNYRFPQSFPKPFYLYNTIAIHFSLLNPFNLPLMVQDSSSPFLAILFNRPMTARMERKILTLNSLPTTWIIQLYYFLFVAVPGTHRCLPSREPVRSQDWDLSTSPRQSTKPTTNTFIGLLFTWTTQQRPIISHKVFIYVFFHVIFIPPSPLTLYFLSWYFQSIYNYKLQAVFLLFTLSLLSFNFWVHLFYLHNYSPLYYLRILPQISSNMYF